MSIRRQDLPDRYSIWSRGDQDSCQHQNQSEIGAEGVAGIRAEAQAFCVYVGTSALLLAVLLFFVFHPRISELKRAWGILLLH